MAEKMELTTTATSNGSVLDNNHTTSGPSFKSEEYYACAAFLFLFSFMGIMENALLLKVLWERTMFHEHIFVAIKTLCGAQLLMSAVCLPMGALSALHESWLFRSGGCAFYAFILNAMYFSCSFVLSALMTVCAFVVCVPSVKQHLTERRTLFVTTTCFALGAIFAVFPLGGIRHYVKEGLGFHCALDWADQSQRISYLVADVTFIFFLPLVVLLITWGITQFSIHKWKRTVLTEDIFELGVAKEDQRRARAVSIITGVTLLTLAPYAVINMERIAGTAIPHSLVTATAILAQTFVTLTPFFIVTTLEKIRKALFQLVMPMEQRSRPVSRNGSIIMPRTGSRVQLRSRMNIYTRHNSVVPRSRKASDASMIGSLYSNNAGMSYMLDDTRGASSSKADKEPPGGSDINHSDVFTPSAEESMYDSAIGALVASRQKTFSNIKQTKTAINQESELHISLPQVEEVSVSTLQGERSSSALEKF